MENTSSTMKSDGQWTWDPAKAEANERKHGVAFEDAVLALEDPSALSEQDWHHDGDRWRTIGQAGPALLFVIHTFPNGASGRIISARAAKRPERKLYET